MIEKVLRAQIVRNVTKLPQNRFSKPKFQINIMADSGTTVNILSKKDYKSFNPNPNVEFPYMFNMPVELQGKFKVEVTSAKCCIRRGVYVMVRLIPYFFGSHHKD